MKDTKYKILDISFYDYQYIQRYLTGMAAKGWHLDRVSGMCFWRFRRGEPKHVRYEITYAPAASAFNSRPSEAEEDLAELCAGAGWVRVAALAQLHIFRNEDPNATPLETDEAQRLANIRQTMKRHFVPQQVLMIGLYLFQFLLLFSNILRWPGKTLASPLMVSTSLMLLAVAVMFAVLLWNCLRWLKRAERDVAQGLPCPENTFYRRFRFVVWAGLIVYLGSLLLMAGMTIVACILGISAITLLCAFGSIALCKEFNAPKWVNVIVPMVTTAGMMVFLLTMFAINNEAPPSAETIPLTLADLTDPADVKTERSVLEESASLLASYGRYFEDSPDLDSGLSLSYTILDVKCEIFYDLCLNEAEENFLNSASVFTAGNLETNLAHLWDADRVWHSSGELNDRWLICWEDRIVSLRAGWPMTDQQIAAAAEILKP